MLCDGTTNVFSTRRVYGAHAWMSRLKFHRDLWCLQTRVPKLSCDVGCVMIYVVIYIEHRLVTERRKDTVPQHIYNEHMRRAVKIIYAYNCFGKNSYSSCCHNRPFLG